METSRTLSSDRGGACCTGDEEERVGDSELNEAERIIVSWGGDGALGRMERLSVVRLVARGEDGWAEGEVEVDKVRWRTGTGRGLIEGERGGMARLRRMSGEGEETGEEGLTFGT